MNPSIYFGLDPWGVVIQWWHEPNNPTKGTWKRLEIIRGGPPKDLIHDERNCQCKTCKAKRESDA